MIKLGDIELAGPIVLAPIAGYTDGPFREICIKHGCGLTVTELISADGIVRKNPKTMDMLKFSPKERPIAIQIFGNDPETMSGAAKIVETLKPDIIDINLGCPARKVCGSGSGASLLKNPSLIRTITESVKKAVSIPVTAKIRTGWDHDNLNYMDVVAALEDGGVSLIAVHGRTRAQMYTGLADWEIIREISRKASVPVIGNGDIDSYDKAAEMMEYSGCPAVMIGRGAIGNPWIFSGKKPDKLEIIEQIKEHLNMMIDEYGDFGIKLMRKHTAKYIHGFRNAAILRKRIMDSADRDEIFGILDLIEE